MDTRHWFLGMGAVLLLAASAPAADAGAGDGDSVAQAGRPRFRTFEGRFGDSDRPRARPGDAAKKEEAKPKPEFRHKDVPHRSAKPGEQAAKKIERPAKKVDGPQHRKPEMARGGRPDWKAGWKPGAASFQGRKPGSGKPGQFAGWHGGNRFGGKFSAASWRGKHHSSGHGQMGRHCSQGKCAFASMHGGRHKHGAMGKYAQGRHRGHGHMGRHGHGSHQMAHGRHHGHHGRYAFGKQRGHHGHKGQFAHRGGRGHKGQFAHRGGQGHRGQFAHRGSHHGRGGWQNRGLAMRGQHGHAGRNMAMARMAAMRWHHRGFGAGQFGRQGQGPRGFAMGPWMMRSQWQGFGSGQVARGPQAGSRPQQFQRPWEAHVRPAGMPGRGPQARGGEGNASIAELKARVDRLQRELERLRRESR